MQPKWHSPRNILIALVLSALIAVAPWELMIVTIPLLLVSLVWTACRSPSAALAQFVIVAVVITAAVLAPVKPVNEILKRNVTLPAKSLTLSELEMATGMGGSQHLPTIMRWRVASDLRKTAVTFSQETMTIRELIEAVESQTPLRHRFSRGCVSGSTLLFGTHPSQLTFRDPLNPYPEDESSDSPESPPLSPPSPAR